MSLQPVAGSSLPFNGGPPRHFNCRSRLRPVTKSFKELGVDAAEVPVSTRASMDGQVPADITFNQFLKKKPKSFQDALLGPKRAELHHVNATGGHAWQSDDHQAATAATRHEAEAEAESTEVAIR
jgi:hypothetical protein